MSPAKGVLYLVTLGIVLGPSIAPAQQLSLSWIDNSGGQAGFIVQRATSTTGPYTQVAQVSLGATSYSDTAVSFGTTYCYQVAAVDGDNVSAFSDFACASPSGGFTLTASKAGTGSGTVSSSPDGISCGTACTSTYSAGKVVTLTATPAAGSTFSGWTSGGCSGTDPCGLAGNGSVTVTATFATIPAYALTVSTKGSGTVSSNPDGIGCGSSCVATYVEGTVVVLTAVPKSGAHFVGWSGDGCQGTGTCTVTVNKASAVSATFEQDRKRWKQIVRGPGGER